MRIAMIGAALLAAVVVTGPMMPGVAAATPASSNWAADVDGDRRADTCRLQGSTNFQDSRVYCDLAKGGGIISGVLDWGYPEGRDMVDMSGDSRADYCRVVGTKNFEHAFVSCTLSNGAGFGATIMSRTLDWGYPQSRYWADANGDGRVDFCRQVGDKPQPFTKCLLSTGSGFGADIIV